ncbi:hypothetical protein I4U23_027560 [Adineta vaga]|nr:hypothetical protein I4U23_027560 [Adineta vaga]
MANEFNVTAHTNGSWWTMPLELLQLTFNGVGLFSSIIFISIVASQHELRQNLALLLAANLSMGGLVFCGPFMIQVSYMLINSVPDRFCSFRGYLYVTGLVYTFQATTLQTVHRLFVTVFVHHRQLQNRWLFLFLALIQFLVSLTALLPLLLGGHFAYLHDGKVCYIAFNDLFGILYPSSIFYFFPLIVQLLLSCWILRHISHEAQAGRAHINVMRRVRKERRVLIRLAIPVTLILGVGLIYFVFVFGTLVTSSSWKAPPYALHLSLMGISAATGAGMLTNAIINKKVWKIICSIFHCSINCRGQNTVHIIVQQRITAHQRTRIRTDN